MKITREVAKELLPFVKALAEGKMIQDKIEGLTGWVDTEEINLEFDGQKILHRIKPESQYRPFKTQEECWQEMLKHQPFGWVKSKDFTITCYIDVFTNDEVRICDAYIHFPDAFKQYEFPDGTPFGIGEE